MGNMIKIMFPAHNWLPNRTMWPYIAFWLCLYMALGHSNLILCSSARLTQILGSVLKNDKYVIYCACVRISQPYSLKLAALAAWISVLVKIGLEIVNLRL